jgi:hypothetical protein
LSVKQIMQEERCYSLESVDILFSCLKPPPFLN